MDRYLAAAIQTDHPNPTHRGEIKRNTDRMLALAEQTVQGYAPFGDVKLLAYPEFGHAAPVYATARELLEHLALPIPNEHTERYVELCRHLDVHIQTGTFLEVDPRWPDRVFNTTCLIGPQGLLYRYRKVNPWLPWEVHSSPHDVPDYPDPLFPVAETPIGRIGTAICYDWLFPETLRQLAANGAEVLVRVSAYMDPWGATPPMDWWTLFNRARAVENLCYVVAANQGAATSNYPPFSWPGGSMIVDPDGRILAQADPGPGEKVVVAAVDLAALRHERGRRRGHQMLAHLRTEAYPVYGSSLFPRAERAEQLTVEGNDQRTAEALRRLRP
jgi:predicted amidohydrolase